MIVYQLDKDFVYVGYPEKKDGKPHRAITTEPPETIPEGYLALWISDLDPVYDRRYGDPGTGKWEVIEDHRGEQFYTADGDHYYGEYKGIGSLPEGVANAPRPTQYHDWDGKEWVLNEDRKAKDEAFFNKKSNEQKLTDEREKAKYMIEPLEDAIELEIATEEEVQRLKEWKKYRVLLSRVPSQPGYPDVIDWPESPERFKE